MACAPYAIPCAARPGREPARYANNAVWRASRLEISVNSPYAHKHHRRKMKPYEEVCKRGNKQCKAEKAANICMVCKKAVEQLACCVCDKHSRADPADLHRRVGARVDKILLRGTERKTAHIIKRIAERNRRDESPSAETIPAINLRLVCNFRLAWRKFFKKVHKSLKCFYCFVSILYQTSTFFWRHHTLKTKL